MELKLLHLNLFLNNPNKQSPFQSLDEKAQKALECPCIGDLRKGPCGNQFSGAFICFLKSTAEEKVINVGKDFTITSIKIKLASLNISCGI